MKKFLMLAAAAMAVTLLSAPMAYAAPSPTEPDRPPVEINDPDVPLADAPVEVGGPDAPLGDAPVEIGDPGVPLGDAPVEIGDPGVPLGDAPVEIDDLAVPFVAAPQTGVTGLSGMEALTLAAMAFAASGVVVLSKARKQTGSVR